MSEQNELKLPKNYKRPSLEEFVASAYPAENYESFFAAHEQQLSARYVAGEVTDEQFDEDLRLRAELAKEMVDADGDGLPDVLHVRSQVRAQSTRMLRARNPTRHRFKQYLFGKPSMRLVRKRALKVLATDVRQNLDELIAKEAAGILSVHTPSGQRVDLLALKAGRVALSTPAPDAPLPNKPLDSAANDIPAGENMPQYLGGTYAGDPIADEVIARMAREKAEAFDGVDPLEASEDPAGEPLAPGGTPPTGVATELEQPPVGVDGTLTPIQDQLPKDSSESVEAPAADPLAEPEVAPAAEESVVAEEQDSSSIDPVSDEPAKEESKPAGKSGKKGGRR